MATKNQVTLTFAGDTQKLENAFDRVGSSAREMDGEVRQSGAGFDNLSERADASEARIIGMKDAVDGVTTVMQGPGQQGIAAYIQGWADLASGFANFILPALKALSVQLIKTASTAVASAARQVVAWTVLSAAATVNAIKIAAAWLISLGPIAIIIAAVVGLVALIVANWDKIRKFVTAAARKTWDFVTNAFHSGINFIKDLFGNVVDFVRSLPGRITSAARGMWDGITDAFRGAINFIIDGWNRLDLEIGPFSIPSWVPGVGGKSFHIADVFPDIPRLHFGGTVPGAPGQEVLAVLQAGERVSRRGHDRMVLEFRSDGTAFGDTLVQVIAATVRARGGDVQAVLSGG